MIGTVWCAQQESYSPSPMGVHCSRELEPRAPTHRCPIHPGIAMARLLAGNPSRCSTLNLPRSSAAMKVPSAAPSWMMCSRPNGLTRFHGGPVGTIGRGRWRRSKGVVDMSVTVIGPGMNSKPSSTHAERSGSASLRHHSRRLPVASASLPEQQFLKRPLYNLPPAKSLDRGGVAILN